jgi:hypothetical protein
MMRSLEFHRQFLAIQIFPDVSQPLLQLKQGIRNILFIGKRNVAPHGIRAG